MAKSIEELIAEGYCDARGAVVGATIVSLPNRKSKFRIVLLCIRDDFLYIYATDLKGNIGERVAVVEISKTENFILKANFWNQLLSFDYEGQHYEFTNFGAHKLLKQVFAEERSK